MPSGSATTKPIESPTNLQPKDKSISQMVKGAGFKDLTHMMASYGLKRHDEADVQEAKAILNAFKQADQEDWEASQRKLFLKQNIDEHPKWQEVHMEVEEIWFRLGDTVKKWSEWVEVELGVGRQVE